MANKLIIRVSIFFIATLGCLSPSFAADYGESFVSDQLQRAQLNPDHRVSFELRAPLEFVFEYLSERVADYADNAVAVEFNHDESRAVDELGVGSKRITLMENNDTLVQRFLLYQPPIRYAYFTDMAASTIEVPLAYSLSYYELTTHESGMTKLDISVVYESSSRWFGFFVNRAFRSALENDFARAVQQIEQEYQD